MTSPQGRRIAWRSLGLARNTSLLIMLLGLGAIAALVKALHVSLEGRAGAGIAFAAFVGGAVVFASVPSLLTRRVRLARLAKLTFPLDRDAYFAALDREAPRAAFAVEAELGEQVVPDVRGLTMVETSAIRPRPGALELVSPAMRTVRSSYFGVYPYNGDLHRWFQAACTGVLLAMDQRHKITALRVRFVPDLEAELGKAEETGAGPPAGEQALPRMSLAQRRGTVRWLVGGLVPALALAIAAGLTDSARYFGGLLAGLVFSSTLALGAVAFVLVQLRHRSPSGTLLRRPLEWLANSVAYTVMAYLILVLAETRIWSLGHAGAAARWYAPGFFAIRTVIYVFLWAGIASVLQRASAAQDDTGASDKLDKLGRLAPRTLAILAATLWLVSLDWIAGLHREALARGLAPLVGANLAAGGIAAAVAVGSLVVLRLDRMKLLGDHATAERRAFAARWMTGASLAWLVTAGGLAAATYASSDAVRAAWEPHAIAGAWQAWTLAMLVLHALPIVVLGAARRSPAAIAIASVLLIAGHALEAGQLVLPAGLGPELPTWIEAGGFVTALAGIWVVMLQSVGERQVYPRRDRAFQR